MICSNKTDKISTIDKAPPMWALFAPALKAANKIFFLILLHKILTLFFLLIIKSHHQQLYSAQ